MYDKETTCYTEELPELPMPELPQGEKGWYVFGAFLLLRYVIYPIVKKFTGRKTSQIPYEYTDDDF